MKNIFQGIIGLCFLATMGFLQGCDSLNNLETKAKDAQDTNTNGGTSTDDDDNSDDDNDPDNSNSIPTIINIIDDQSGEGIIPGQGLKGKIFYFLNETGSPDLPDEVKDKNGLAYAFPDGVTSAKTIIENGYELPANIILTSFFVPTFSFQRGFIDSTGGVIKDLLGNSLFEAFAIQVEGTIEKVNGMEPGDYEFSLISDDGAVLEADMDGDGVYETTLVDNSGPHASQMGCSADKITFVENEALPIRLRYYQGPRDHISLNLLLRKIEDGESPGQDPLCGFNSNEEWFNFEDSPTYVPDLVNSKYGEVISRGWFRPDPKMFRND